ncbi:MAG: diguanylate cyclase [Arenibacterium sp.]
MTSCETFINAVDAMCPMFVLLDPGGKIVRVGPTLQKLRPDAALVGQNFLAVFKLDRPRAVTSMADMLARSKMRLRLEFRSKPSTSFKGVIIPLPDGGGAIVNLSFGISVLEAVRDYKLNSSDFATTDLTIELLYLVEAKSAAMSASRKLNERLKVAMNAAEEKAFTDTLTGLRNRRAVDYLLDRLMLANRDFAVMNLDLDRFKAVNDTYGHAAGDHLLCHIATLMQQHTQSEDTIGRVGGDEFLLIITSKVEREKLEKTAEGLIAAISEPIPFQGGHLGVGASIGICISEEEVQLTTAELLRQADVALYEAKHAGRGQYRFFDPTMDRGFAAEDFAQS